MDKKFCKYYKLRKYTTRNCGDINWIANDEYKSGDLYEEFSDDCASSIKYRWSLIDEYDCQEFEDKYIYYFANGDGVSVGCDENIAITHNGITRVTIKACAHTVPSNFIDGLSSLSFINIESGITSIGDNAFNSSVSLSAVSIPSTVTEIGKYAFKNCTNLRSISLGSNIDFVKPEAFSNCLRLNNAVVSSKKIGASFPEEAELPYSNGIFVRYNCENEKPQLFNGVFQNCKNITSVTINEGVEYLGGGTFNGCERLLSINLPSTIKGIGAKLGQYTVSGSTDGQCPTLTYVNSKIGFCSGCTSLSSITINDGIEFIGNRAFQDCSSLVSITILSSTPPELIYSESNDVSEIKAPFDGTSCPIYVPSGSVEAYKTAWADYADRITSL